MHSKYSRACSKELTIPNMEKYAKIKGVGLMGTGDFQHPKWQPEIKEHLTEDDTGILRTKNNFPFMLTSEISLIYSQGGKGRKVHNVIFAKSFEIAAQVSDTLLKYGRIDYDGRPIFGMNCPEFVEIMKSVDKVKELNSSNKDAEKIVSENEDLREYFNYESVLFYWYVLLYKLSLLKK